jgi:gamma-glutamylcyclotransferase (GGCT)/AIG2-like uncharacterized protein YtfP
MSDTINIFVYGTLKPGESNYQQYCAGRVLEAKRAIAFGQLFALPFGYPAMTEENTQFKGFYFLFPMPLSYVSLISRGFQSLQTSRPQ